MLMFMFDVFMGVLILLGIMTRNIPWVLFILFVVFLVELIRAKIRNAVRKREMEEMIDYMEAYRDKNYKNR